jgi:MoxR-like ATPase
VIVKDLANRSIPTCLVQKDAYFCEEILKYQESINQWQSALADVNAEVKRGRSEFNASLPHPFVDTDLIVSIDQEITTIANEIDNTIAKHRKLSDRASMLVNLLRASSC